MGKNNNKQAHLTLRNSFNFNVLDIKILDKLFSLQNKTKIHLKFSFLQFQKG